MGFKKGEKGEENNGEGADAGVKGNAKQIILSKEKAFSYQKLES